RQPSHRLCATADPDRAGQPAGPVVAVAADAAAPATDRFSTDAAVVRYRAEGRDARAYAVVADADPAARRGTGDLRGRPSDLQSDRGRNAFERAACHADR